MISGRMAAYSGGGYTVDLVHDQSFSTETLQMLKKENWLDDRTRALFVEITTYNAQVNLFTVMNLIVEILPTGGLQHFCSIRIARLYTFGGSTESFTLACKFFVFCFMLLFVYKESKKVYRQKRSYFNGFWNLLEFCLVVLTITALGLFLKRLMLVDAAVQEIQNNPGRFVSFNKVVQWDTLFSALSSMIVFVSCLKGLRLLQYNKTISILSSTLQGCAKPLSAFFIIFIVFFVAFTVFAYILFMPYLDNFSTFVTSMESVMALLLGDFNFSAIESTKPILGKVWFFLLMLFGSMYIMNVFLAIIMDAYGEVTENISLQSREYEIVDFIINRFKMILGQGDGGQKALLARIDEKEKQGEKKAGKATKKRNGRKKYFKMLDNEIEMKFAQLDDSLDGFWMDTCDKDAPALPTIENYGCGIYHGNKNNNKNRLRHVSFRSSTSSSGFDNPSFDYQEVDSSELLMQRDLARELERWS